MSNRRGRKSNPLATQLAELAVAVPQVIAHRVTRLAFGGASPSEQDRKEFHLMSAEKLAAFNESWIAMSVQAARANHQWTMDLMRSFWSPWSDGAKPSSAAVASRQLGNTCLDILSQGMAPVHRRAVSNAKRLKRRSRK